MNENKEQHFSYRAVYYYELYTGEKGTWICDEHSNALEELKKRYPKKPVRYIKLLNGEQL